MENVLAKIADRSAKEPKAEWLSLMCHFTKENLAICFYELDGRKAVGVDKVTKEKYGINLEENLQNLVDKLKTMSYKPGPVREVMIPKENGKLRPLGISNLEDKIIQSMFAKVLTAIYDPLMCEFSYGFRPKRSCHNAIKALSDTLSDNAMEAVLDIDLRNYFGTISHEKLVALLRMKIKDERFIRYIIRMLKAGVLANGELRMDEFGCPQGSCVSPILANIYAHYAIDTWFVNEELRKCECEASIVRYADDMVICCRNREDADMILEDLKMRLERFSLELSAEKTKIVSFNYKQAKQGYDQETFDFLGFTFYIGKSRNGRKIRKLKTSSKRFRSKLKKVEDWCQQTRHRGNLKTLWKIFRAKMRGHIQYYAVSFNGHEVSSFLYESKRAFFKWMNRRSQKRSFDWNEFNRFMERYPLPKVTIKHKLF